MYQHMFSGNQEEVQQKIIKEIHHSSPHVFLKSLHHHCLSNPLGTDNYNLVAFSSTRYRTGYGYLISNSYDDCRGLYLPNHFQLVEAARFARMVIPELFESLTDDEHEHIFNNFIKVSVIAVVQDEESSTYLSSLLTFA